MNRARDRGATLVEVAIIVPVLAIFVLGIIEFGFAWRDVNSVERAVQTAGRVVSSLGRERFADYETLRSLASSLDGVNGAELQRVIVFDATSTGGVVPDVCLDVTTTPALSPKGVGGMCNVYSREQVETENPVGFPETASPGCPSGSWDRLWCPNDREQELPAPDRVGVYVELEYHTFTSLLPGPTISVDRTAVYQVEPCVVGGGVEC